MTRCSSVHHVEMCLQDAEECLRLFTRCLGFSVIGTRRTATCQQWVLRQQDSTFILTQRSTLQKSHYCLPDNAQPFQLEATDNTNIEQLTDFSQAQGHDDTVDVKTLNNDDSIWNNSKDNSLSDNALAKISTDANSNCFTDASSDDCVPVNDSPFTEEWTVFCCRSHEKHVADSVFNTALNVCDVHDVTLKAQQAGGTVIKQPTVLKDKHGQVNVIKWGDHVIYIWDI